MIRIGTVIWFVVLALLGVGLFQVKYAVQAKERDLRAVNRQITADRQILRVLEAEWSYLNDPVRLADLTRRHTDLVPAMANQIAGFDSLRDRPAGQPVPDLPLPEQSAPEAPGAESPRVGDPVQPAPLMVSAEPQGTPPVQQARLPGAAAGGGSTFQTSAAPAAAEADEDATIRAILADMEAKQNGAEAMPPAAGGGQ